MCSVPLEALEQCRELGVDTILTSGQEGSCLEGLGLIEKLCKLSQDVEILIGAGVDADAIRQVRQRIPQAESFHMSGKALVESGMSYRKEGVSMGLPSMSEFEIWRTDEGKVRAAWEALNQ